MTRIHADKKSVEIRVIRVLFFTFPGRECFVVTGLGLVGLLTGQILRANGCRVLGIDLNSRKCELARQFGAETVDLSQGGAAIQAALSLSHDRGVDGMLITAATKSSEPVHQVAQMCRQRGRIFHKHLTNRSS